MTGVLFFMQRIIANATEDFSQEHIQLVTKGYKIIATRFGINKDETIAMVFRIGFCIKLNTRSLRLTPEIHFE